MPAASAPGTLAEGLFASAEGGAFLSGLETFASAVGSAAFLGAISVPTPAGVVSHGAIPGEPGLSYSFDEPAGLLRLHRDDKSGQQTVAEARLRPDGILAETETGLPIARMVGGGASSLTPIRSLGRQPEPRRGASATNRSFVPIPDRDVHQGP